MSTTWVEAQAAHGPALAEWLERKGVEADQMRKWRKGGLASLQTVDFVLTRNGLHISELPDELWTDQPPVRRARTHCKRGHLLAGPNLYVDPHGKRECRECWRARKRGS